jgi:hypothetical protein
VDALIGEGVSHLLVCELVLAREKPALALDQGDPRAKLAVGLAQPVVNGKDH